MANYLSHTNVQRALRSPTHQPTNAYTTGLPGPPRILIPPPTLQPEQTLYDPCHYQASTEQMMVSPSSSVLPTSLQDWKYESRREAQQLLPHLWLGPNSAAKNAQFIQQEGITLLLAIRSAMTAKAKLLTSQLPGVRYESIDVARNQQLISHFQRGTQLIDEHYLSESPFQGKLTVPIDSRELHALQKNHVGEYGRLVPGGRTLLFCESGNERSAAMAAAYIMQHLWVDAVQAIQIVQSRRFCVCFDDSVKWLLASYEPIWRARRQIREVEKTARQNESANQNHESTPTITAPCNFSGGGNGGSNKRRFEDDEESMEYHKSFVPFADGGDRDDVDMA
ncbi:hypothetical protein RUND412_010076 [Rhizina undulata]